MLALLATTHAVQLHALRTLPQPILFGDAEGYYVVGQRLSRAVSAWSGGAPFAEALESVRGVLYFAGVGAVYAAIDALRPGDVPFARELLAGFNTLAALAAFLLARRLADSAAAGLIALAVAAVYPPFSLQTGRLLPDPVTGCLFAWSAWLAVEALWRRRLGLGFGAGLLLGAGLLVRPQLLSYVLLLAVLAAAASARRWWPQRETRRVVLALALGLLPAAGLWGAIVAASGDDLSQIEALGNFTFRPRYPYGFWQFLDSDGWMGAYPLGTEPYRAALEAAARDSPGLLESRAQQWQFTAGYVLSRPLESLLLVCDDAWRLYDRPANDYKRDYPFAYPLQVGLQRGVMLLALAAAAWLGRARPAALVAFFLPACLALLHGLSYPWPRFNQPAMPILIAAAGTGAVALARSIRGVPAGRRRVALAWAGAALALLATGSLLAERLPELARALGLGGTALLLAAPFAWLAAGDGPRRRWPLAVGGLLLALFCAHALRDRRWHETSTDLAQVGRVEQEIRVDPGALPRLRDAPELFLVFDLLLPDGSPRGLSLEVAGRRLPGEALQPSMPRFGESTAAGGRDRHQYPQWWVLRLDPDWLPESGVLQVALESDGARPARLAGDRFAAAERVYEGPSFGDWPRRAAVKLEYDGDYRLPLRTPLASAGTLSRAGRGAEARRPLRSIHRIRLLALADRRGHLAWETAPAPDAGPAGFAFAAFSGTRGSASLRAGEATLELPLQPDSAWQRRAPGVRLCHQPGPVRGEMHHGDYLLGLDAVEPRRPLGLELTFLPGMSDEGMFFSLARGAGDPEAQARLAAACGLAPGTPLLPGVGRVLDASRNSHPDATGRWQVAAAY